MRNPERIDTILDLIEDIWRKYPDLRLGQLLINVIGTHMENNLFYYEDDSLIRDLENWKERKE